MKLNERVLAAIYKQVEGEAHKEVKNLQRKLRVALAQRDVWKEKAYFYQARLLEKQ
jgi:hypothetical protein